MVSEPTGAAGRPSGGVALPHPHSHAVPEAPLATAASSGDSKSHLPAWVTNDRKVLQLHQRHCVLGAPSPVPPAAAVGLGPSLGRQ